VRLFDFAPDEACRFGCAKTASRTGSTDLTGGVAAAEVGSYPAFSPLPDHLNTQKCTFLSV